MYYYHRQWMIDNVSMKVPKLHKVWFSTHSNYFVKRTISNFNLIFCFPNSIIFDQELNDNQLPMYANMWFLKDRATAVVECIF